eukprot:gene34127-biopygen14623
MQGAGSGHYSRRWMDEEWRRALDGTISIKDMAKPSGKEGALRAKPIHSSCRKRADQHGSPADARNLLLQFRKWMQLMPQDYAWHGARKFYDHFYRQTEKDASAPVDLPDGTPLFQTGKQGKRGGLVPMSHLVLVAGLKGLAKQVGHDPARYAGHSLRQGGSYGSSPAAGGQAVHQVPGDLKSNCYERYCELDNEQRLILLNALS